MAEPIEVASPDWIAAAANALGPDQVLALVQGYPYSGFGVVNGNAIHLPGDRSLQDPGLYWDLRLFSNRGEWHGWKTGTVWRERRFPNEKSSELYPISRDYILWGDKPELIGEWSRFIETRGAEVWVPGSHATPLRLHVKLLVDYHPESHLAGIVDAVIVRVEGRTS